MRPRKLEASVVPYRVFARIPVWATLNDTREDWTVTGDTGGFEPVLLNLSDHQDYYVVTEALREFAAAMDHQAEGEDDRVRYNKLPDSDSDAPRLREVAERARALEESIERQLDANSEARRTVGDSGS